MPKRRFWIWRRLGSYYCFLCPCILQNTQRRGRVGSWVNQSDPVPSLGGFQTLRPQLPISRRLADRRGSLFRRSTVHYPGTDYNNPQTTAVVGIRCRVWLQRDVSWTALQSRTSENTSAHPPSTSLMHRTNELSSSSSSSWRRRKQALRGLCVREIDDESQTLVTEYYSKLRFPMPWRSAL